MGFSFQGSSCNSLSAPLYSGSYFGQCGFLGIFCTTCDAINMVSSPFARSRPTSPNAGALLSPRHIISLSVETDEKEELLIDDDGGHQVWPGVGVWVGWTERHI